MNNTEAEKMLMGLFKLYQEYAQDSGAMDKSGLSKMMKENFPTFLSACVSGGLSATGQEWGRNEQHPWPWCASECQLTERQP